MKLLLLADPDTSGLLGEMTMASAAGDQPTDMEMTDDVTDEPADDILTPPAQQQAAPSPLSQVQPALLHHLPARIHMIACMLAPRICMESMPTERKLIKEASVNLEVTGLLHSGPDASGARWAPAQPRPAGG